MSELQQTAFFVCVLIEISNWLILVELHQLKVLRYKSVELSSDAELLEFGI